MIIKTATHLGMCFGVRDAIEIARDQAAQGPMTILGDLVHNPTVIEEFTSLGVQTEPDHRKADTSTLMITAHGTSDRTRKELAASKRTIQDATCPLVHYAHRQLQSLVAAGCYPVIIGVAGHVEVNGLVGDLAEYRIVLKPSDLVSVPDREHYGVVAQTTQPIDRVRNLTQALQEAFPNSRVTFRDTVCQPTKNRQLAASELARKADVVIVIGGRHSNNTHELVAVASQHCHRVYHIQSESDLRRTWFRPEDLVGITAGTSTLPSQVEAVSQRLESWNTVPTNAQRQSKSSHCEQTSREQQTTLH